MSWTRSEIPGLTGLTRRQVASLSEKGILRPALRGPSGRGTATIYSENDLFCLAVLARLIELFGEIPREPAIRAVAALRESQDGYLIIEPGEASVVGYDSACELIRGGAQVVIPLDPVVEKIRRMLLKRKAVS